MSNCGGYFTIQAEKVLDVTYPNGGETLTKGTEYTITWTSSSSVTGNLRIDLYKGSGTTPVLPLAANDANDGSYPFNPPVSLADGSDYKICISAESGTVSNCGDSFLLEDPAQQCGILEVTAYAGSDIYTPPSADYQYHYGPSIILTGNIVDIWTCSPDPSPDSWDRIEHRRGTIIVGGAIQWTTDWVSVLEATPNSRDRYSACDPGVFAANGYYYIGYTSTDQEEGAGATSNDVFITRCDGLPDGSIGVTCNKWNGTGWGGNPQPIIEYTGDSWGIGQPSFVVKDNILYLYYTDNGTKVATADITNVNWPLTLDFNASPILVNEQAEILLGGKPGPFDVKYIDDLARFIGVGVSFEFNPASNVFVYESLDGLNFTSVATSRDYWTAGILQDRAHNIGLSGDSGGHMQLSNTNFIAYAYGRPNGDPNAVYNANWSTYLNPIDISVAANCGLYGDVNHDGLVDLSDAVLALTVVAGTVPPETVNIDADVNSDGKIGIAEVIYVLRNAAGL